MSITREENDLITLVEGDAPLGAMLRQHYWIPAYPASVVEADGKPIRVRLIGKNYVVFRDTSGSVGILDELCPHRLASLALGRNENNGLRCLYQGWKFDVNGNVVDVPNVEGEQAQQRYCKSLRVNKYRAEERSGIIWVWLGQGDVAPMFPNLPFTDLPSSHVAVTSQVVRSNWLQGVEASMDTTHVSWLHQSAIEILTGGTGPLSNTNVARTANWNSKNDLTVFDTQRSEISKMAARMPVSIISSRPGMALSVRKKRGWLARPSCGLVALNIGQPGDAVALQTAMQ